ncbi:tripartite tricarboxylate transporter permease [Pseudoglutamicibacter cumminsii]|uniref:tripartite tricarboxylate transporter permease n=1 Tax=Pseudoglutamicibacter cumminsii TaxID=156979 RepID=UPI001EF91E3C|nr:tripartite tricarboxylate transporter permease [Pseudoglutamicibacter cumminsii]MBM7795804.1 putative tricarboxylic transport membrane protein [Pseudoglutamicibacter cumminsii]
MSEFLSFDMPNTLLVGNVVAEGALAVLNFETLIYIFFGMLVGMLVGAFPGVTATMAVALASGFTLTLEPTQGLAVLLTIYVAAQFGDRVPAILLNTPGTPASISTTFDGYPMAKKGQAGLAMTTSAFASAFGMIFGIILLSIAGIPLSQFAMKFGPPELFALVVFGLTMMIGVSSGRIIKGLIAGLFGLALATVGRDPITGGQRFVFDIPELNSGIPFIPVIIGLFGVAEVLNQMMTHRKAAREEAPITQMNSWMPSRSVMRRILKPMTLGAGSGSVVGMVPAVGGDIAGIIAWDSARRVSKKPEEFGKGSVEGLTAGDTASTATLGGSVTTSMSLGVPGDSVMAVIIGSMMIWGIQPGPALFSTQPQLVFTLATIMLVATVLSLGVSLVRMKGMVKLLELPKPYLWTIILVFCMVGTYSINNSVFEVIMMMIFGLVGLFMVRFGFPTGPTVLGLILGPLAESNLRRTLIGGGLESLWTSPIAMVLLIISALALLSPVIRGLVTKRKKAGKKIGYFPHP